MLVIFYKYIFPSVVFFYIIGSFLGGSETNLWLLTFTILWFIWIIFDWVKSREE